VTGPADSVTEVTASWIVPAVTCSGSNNTYSSFGNYGLNNSTVEQIGTESDCMNGVPNYYAWYELVPENTKAIKILTVGLAPGDSISAEVS